MGFYRSQHHFIDVAVVSYIEMLKYKMSLGGWVLMGLLPSHHKTTVFYLLDFKKAARVAWEKSL